MYTTSTRVLIHNLIQSGTKQDIVVLCLSSVSEETKGKFKRDGAKVKEVPNIPHVYQTEQNNLKLTYPNRHLTSTQPRNELHFEKIFLWNMGEYERVLYHENDNFVLKNIDSLFFCGNFCVTFNDDELFDTGLMVVKPNKGIYVDLLRNLLNKKIQNKFGLESIFFNEYFKQNIAFNISQKTPLFNPNLVLKTINDRNSSIKSPSPTTSANTPILNPLDIEFMVFPIEYYTNTIKNLSKFTPTTQNSPPITRPDPISDPKIQITAIAHHSILHFSPMSWIPYLFLDTIQPWSNTRHVMETIDIKLGILPPTHGYFLDSLNRGVLPLLLMPIIMNFLAQIFSQNLLDKIVRIFIRSILRNEIYSLLISIIGVGSTFILSIQYTLIAIPLETKAELAYISFFLIIILSQYNLYVLCAILSAPPCPSIFKEVGNQVDFVGKTTGGNDKSVRNNNKSRFITIKSSINQFKHLERMGVFRSKIYGITWYQFNEFMNLLKNSVKGTKKSPNNLHSLMNDINIDDEFSSDGDDYISSRVDMHRSGNSSHIGSIDSVSPSFMASKTVVSPKSSEQIGASVILDDDHYVFKHFGHYQDKNNQHNQNDQKSGNINGYIDDGDQGDHEDDYKENDTTLNGYDEDEEDENDDYINLIFDIEFIFQECDFISTTTNSKQKYQKYQKYQKFSKQNSNKNGIVTGIKRKLFNKDFENNDDDDTTHYSGLNSHIDLSDDDLIPDGNYQSHFGSGRNDFKTDKKNQANEKNKSHFENANKPSYKSQRYRNHTTSLLTSSLPQSSSVPHNNDQFGPSKKSNEGNITSKNIKNESPKENKKNQFLYRLSNTPNNYLPKTSSNRSQVSNDDDIDIEVDIVSSDQYNDSFDNKKHDEGNFVKNNFKNSKNNNKNNNKNNDSQPTDSRLDQLGAALSLRGGISPSLLINHCIILSLMLLFLVFKWNGHEYLLLNSNFQIKIFFFALFVFIFLTYSVFFLKKIFQVAIG
jgi:hypothetical protein